MCIDRLRLASRKLRPDPSFASVMTQPERVIGPNAGLASLSRVAATAESAALQCICAQVTLSAACGMRNQTQRPAHICLASDGDASSTISTGTTDCGLDLSGAASKHCCLRTTG